MHIGFLGPASFLQLHPTNHHSNIRWTCVFVFKSVSPPPPSSLSLTTFLPKTEHHPRHFPPPGCSNSYSQEGDQAHICPRCHNASVYAVKLVNNRERDESDVSKADIISALPYLGNNRETKCLEICCIPLVPLGTNHIFQCSICRSFALL